SLARSCTAEMSSSPPDAQWESGEVNFEIEIDDLEIENLAETVQNQLRDDAAKRSEFASFALMQVIRWMAGRTAYQSLTEQQTAWLTELLPTFFGDRVPTPSQIFNSFSVPYGRAAYISRVLLEKQNTHWRNKGKAILVAALSEKRMQAEHNVQQ